jgi:hypothetical protein
MPDKLLIVDIAIAPENMNYFRQGLEQKIYFSRSKL